MSSTAKSVRHRRFRIKDPAKVKLVVETATGARLHFQVLDCSLSGLGVSREGTSALEGMDSGTLIPAGKIVSGSEEYSLGRLVVRRISNNTSETVVALSLIDLRVPMDGILAKHLDRRQRREESPYEFETGDDEKNFQLHDTAHTGTDLFDRVRRLTLFHKQAEKQAPLSLVRAPSKGTRGGISRQGERPRNEHLIFSSRDALGFSYSTEVEIAVTQALIKYGSDAILPSPAGATTELHTELEALTARVTQREAVVLFPSGYLALLGLITSLTAARDLVVADLFCHPAIQDALRMTHATARYYRHCAPKHLEKILTQHRDQHVGALLITDGVFPDSGATPSLKELSALAEEFNARLLVNETRSFGTVGANGFGISEKFPGTTVDLIVGSYAQIGGGDLGFVACSKEMAQWLMWRSRPPLGSIATTATAAASALEALRLLQGGQEHLQRLQRNIRRFSHGLSQLGITVPQACDSPEVRVTFPRWKQALQLGRTLYEHSIHAAFDPSAWVAGQGAWVSFYLSASHSDEDIDATLRIIDFAMGEADRGKKAA